MIQPINWHIVEKDLVVPGIQRVGSTSLNAGFPNMVQCEEAMTFERRLIFLRHPIARLVSAYSHLNDIEYISEEKVLWEDFVDFILIHEDRHWAPQTPRYWHKGDYMPTHVERFEDLQDVWPKYTDKVYPHKNRSPLIAVCDTSYRGKDIDKYYEEDFELWNTLP